MIIRLFDFDRTITINHTFGYPHHYAPENNIKSGIDHFLLHNQDNIASIVSFHNNPDYIKSYIEHILGKKLTLLKTIDNEHDKLSIYSIDGSLYPLLISTVHPENYETHILALAETGKNTQIKCVLEYLQKTKHKIDYQNTQKIFYDDSSENFEFATNLGSEVGPIDCCLVSASSDEFSIQKTASINEKQIEQRTVKFPSTRLNTPDISIPPSPDSNTQPVMEPVPSSNNSQPIDDANNVNQLLIFLHHALSSYRQSGRLNWFASFFCFKPAHDTLAKNLMSDINKILNEKSPADEKYASLSGVLTPALVELAAKDSKRLHEAILRVIREHPITLENNLDITPPRRANYN